ncbi:hypothetical protein Tco_0322636 [Tanacetum coccineum]
MEKLDHMVKDFHLFEYNKGMETRKWLEDDKRRSKDFITAIEKRLQIRRIFRSLESFVGGRIRDIDYRLINRTTLVRLGTIPNDPAITGGIYPGTIPLVSVEVLRANIKQALEVTCASSIQHQILIDNWKETMDHLKMEIEMEIPSSSNVMLIRNAQTRPTLVIDKAQDTVKDKRKMNQKYYLQKYKISNGLRAKELKRLKGIIKTESGRMITKNIDDMTIAEYMEYEAEMRRDPWRYTRNSGLTTPRETKSLENMHQPDKLKTNNYFPSIPTCFEPAQLHTDDIHEPLGNKPNDYHLFTPQSHYETEEVSSDEDVDEWLNEELSKRMTGQDKEEEEDALIDILKTVGVSFVAEEEEGGSSETLPSIEINPGSFTLPCTIGNLKIYVMADVGAGINMMPKSLFEHLKLANLKKTSMVIEMEIYMINATSNAPSDASYRVKETNDVHNENNYCNHEQGRSRKKPRKLEFNINLPSTHFCKPVKQILEGELKFWPTCDPYIKECNGGHEMYEMNKEGDLKKWYCYYDDDRKKINGVGLSFPEFLLVKYRENQEKGLIWDERFEEWCSNNPNAPTSKFTSIYDNLNPRTKDYPLKVWLFAKVGHTNVSKPVKKTLLKSWLIDCFQEDVVKDPQEGD